MDSEKEPLVCGREEDLVGFLYGELDQSEMQAFRMHMEGCASCNSEAASFGNIRQSVIAWRDESLGVLHSHCNVYLPVPRHSASAALREFFNLSPVWMKAAVGFASVLFCVFAVLAVSGLREPPAPIVVNSGDQKSSTQEINEMVERRVREELTRLRESNTAGVAPDELRPVNVSTNDRTKRVTKTIQNDARRPLTRVEREQLAADLRLIAGSDDIELQLLSDTINQ